MILFHGSYLEVAEPNLQICFRAEKSLKLLRFEGSDMV